MSNSGIGLSALAIAFLALILALSGMIYPVSEPHASTHLHDGIDPLFWLRMPFITQFGTAGRDMSSGTGYILYNWDFYFAVNTGETINSYMERWLMPPWPAMAFKQEWEAGTFIRKDFGYSQRYYGWGNNRFADQTRVYTYSVDNQYACFWLVRDPTYNRRILAVTRNGINVNITDCGAWVLNQRLKLRIDLISASLQKFYVDNVLKASHTAPTLTFGAPYGGGIYVKMGISNQAAYDESQVFYYVRGRCDY